MIRKPKAWESVLDALQERAKELNCLYEVEKALAEGALRRDNAQLRDLLQRRRADHGLVYRSDAMETLIEQA